MNRFKPAGTRRNHSTHKWRVPFSIPFFLNLRHERLRILCLEQDRRPVALGRQEHQFFPVGAVHADSLPARNPEPPGVKQKLNNQIAHLMDGRTDNEADMIGGQDREDRRRGAPVEGREGCTVRVNYNSRRRYHLNSSKLYAYRRAAGTFELSNHHQVRPIQFVTDSDFLKATAS